MTRHISIFAALCLIPTATAAQPYSQSMTQCAALNQNAAQFVRDDATADVLLFATTAWAEAALAQAQTEGQSLTMDQVWDMVDSQTATWETNGARWILSQEFRDWSDYCKSFARHTGVTTRPS